MRIWKNRGRPVRIEYAYLCHRGNVRDENQDNMILCADEHIVMRNMEQEIAGAGSCLNSIKCAVFDGMGGMSQGEMASVIAVDVMKESIKDVKVKEADINTLFQKMNEGIDDYRTCNRISNMGTTGVLVIADHKEFVYGNIGDSRLYHLRKGKLQQCSVDHTMKQPYTGKRLLIQYLGMDSDYEIEPHIGRQKVECGDEIILCSDGLTDCVPDEELEKILNNRNHVAVQLQELKETVLKREAQDNISVILCRWEYER